MEERLWEDASQGQRTSLPMEDIIHLLSFCFKTTQFACNSTYYQQVFGTAMGFTCLCCHCQHGNERRGTKGLSHFTTVKPFFWKQYVDVISVVSGNEAEHLLSHLNTAVLSIQFILKHEKGRHLPLLDFNVSRGEQGNLETSVYCKPTCTHTDKYLAFDSHHLICHKKSV